MEECYIGLQKMNSTIDSKTSKMALYFLLWLLWRQTYWLFIAKCVLVEHKNVADNFLVDEYHSIFFCENYFCRFYKFEGRGYNWLTVSSEEIRTSLIQYFQSWNPLSNDLKQNLAKICNRDVSDNENRTDCCVVWSSWHSAYSTCTKTFTKYQGILEFSVCLF